MHREPAAPVMPKTLHGICTNKPLDEERIKLQKDFPFPLFSLYKVLSESFQDLYIYILKLLQKNFTFFVNKAKTFHWICRMHQTPKGIKTFQFSIHKKYQKCSWIYVGFRRQLDQKVWEQENEGWKKQDVKSKSWSYCCEMAPPVFCVDETWWKPQKESQTKHILGTWCRYLKHKTILIFEYPSIPVWGYECPTKRNLSFIEYFPNSNINRLELSSLWEQIYAFQVTEIALGCNGGGVARGILSGHWFEAE